MTVVSGLECVKIFLMGLAGQELADGPILIGPSAAGAAVCHHRFPYMDR